jgi:hypothetical protein
MRLCEGLSYSYTILASLWGNIPLSKSWIRKLFEHYKAWKMNPRERRIYKAQIRGYDRAMQKY